jgi:hypothetical protein
MIGFSRNGRKRDANDYGVLRAHQSALACVFGISPAEALKKERLRDHHRVAGQVDLL